MVNNLLCYDYKDKYNIPIDRLFLIFFLFRYLFLVKILPKYSE